MAKSRSYQDVIEGCDDVPSPMAVDSQLIPQRHCYLYAWCLMGNHVHLLLKEADEPIGDVMFYYSDEIGDFDYVDNIFAKEFESFTGNLK